MLNKERIDSRPTMSEWPVRIWSMEELPPQYAAHVIKWAGGSFLDYDFVYAPKRRTNAESFDYLFGYGNGKIIYMREHPNGMQKSLDGAEALQVVELQKQQVIKALTERELLNAKIILHYRSGQGQEILQFPDRKSVV